MSDEKKTVPKRELGHRRKSSLFYKDHDPDELLKKHFESLTLESSVLPIPYSAEVPSPQPTSRKTAAPAPSDDELKHKKVSIVGCGQVGMAITYAILNQEIAGSIALVDVDERKLDGEATDLRHGSAFHQRVRIQASSDYSITAGSHLVIVTAGVARKPGDSRLDLVQKNAKIMKSIVEPILHYSPNTPICIISNPCDIMTAIAAKIAGPSVPPGRIFGSGTCLDSSRLRSLIAMALDVDTRSVHGYIIGEHGDSSIPVWSGVTVGGVHLLKVGQQPTEAHQLMHKEIVESGGEVIQKKGYTNWAIGLTGAHIARNVLHDTRAVLPVSTCVRGLYTPPIEHDVFLTLPCVVGANGVSSVITLGLSESEDEGFRKSATSIWEVQKGVWDQV